MPLRTPDDTDAVVTTDDVFTYEVFSGDSRKRSMFVYFLNKIPNYLWKDTLDRLSAHLSPNEIRHLVHGAVNILEDVWKETKEKLQKEKGQVIEHPQYSEESRFYIFWSKMRDISDINTVACIIVNPLFNLRILRIFPAKELDRLEKIFSWPRGAAFVHSERINLLLRKQAAGAGLRPIL